MKITVGEHTLEGRVLAFEPSGYRQKDSLCSYQPAMVRFELVHDDLPIEEYREQVRVFFEMMLKEMLAKVAPWEEK